MTILQFILAHFLYDLFTELTNVVLRENKSLYKILLKDRMKRNRKNEELIEEILDEEFEIFQDKES